MLTKSAVLSPVDRADLAHCECAAASQPAQSSGQKKHTEIQKRCKFWGPFWGPFLDPKMGLRLAALLKILLKPDFEAHFEDLFWDPKLGPKIDQKLEKKSAKNSEKLDKGGSRDSEKSDLQKPAKATWNPLQVYLHASPPSTDHLQRALAASTGCVYVTRHALPMI